MLSGNEVERLKSLRGKLAVLCPETDGLQAKHRIKRKHEERPVHSARSEYAEHHRGNESDRK